MGNEVGYCKPPIETRFKPGNPIKGGRPKGSISVLTELKKLLKKKIDYEDPTTKLQVKGTIAQALALRHVYNALEGENASITDILDRVDGKVHNGNGTNIAILNYVYGFRRKEENVNPRT